MERAGHKQKDLFEQATPTMALQPHLRTKLGALLQALLAEAAGVEGHQTKPADRGGAEDGDDQDHA
jgi:hypothetical protein